METWLWFKRVLVDGVALHYAVCNGCSTPIKYNKKRAADLINVAPMANSIRVLAATLMIDF